MDPQKIAPPGFTSLDTSYEASLKVPSLELGLPRLPPSKRNPSRGMYLRDVSGNYVSNRLASMTFMVMLNPSQKRKTPSAKIEKENE
jgi:hypothetical protein